MLISQKQHAANRNNAQLSTGPVTTEGKARTRLNALRYGLRAQSLIITGEDPEEYKQLWDDLEADWQPRNRTERHYLEQMATSEWLLARIAAAEARIFDQELAAERQLALLERFSTMRARLERSFTSAMRELERLQKKSAQAAQPQDHAAQPHPVAPAWDAAEPPAPRACAPGSIDSR